MSKSYIQPYLFFGGRCEETLEFYRKAVGAETLFIMRHNETPGPSAPGMLQEGFENKICHCTFRIGDSELMGSDGCNDQTSFEGFRLSLTLPTVADAERAFAALTEKGKVDLPLEKTFWSPCFGMLTDKFGIGWMVTVKE